MTFKCDYTVACSIITNASDLFHRSLVCLKHDFGLIIVDEQGKKEWGSDDSEGIVAGNGFQQPVVVEVEKDHPRLSPVFEFLYLQ